MLVNGIEIYKFKADNKNIQVLTQFCLRSLSNKFEATDSREGSSKENMYEFSVDYNDTKRFKHS